LQPVGDNAELASAVCSWWNTGTSPYGNDIATWDISLVDNFDGLFTGCPSFNAAGINQWSVSHVTSMDSTFFYVNGFNQPLGNWDTRNVRNMASMVS